MTTNQWGVLTNQPVEAADYVMESAHCAIGSVN